MRSNDTKFPHCPWLKPTGYGYNYIRALATLDIYIFQIKLSRNFKSDLPAILSPKQP